MLILHLASSSVRGVKWAASRWSARQARQKIERLPAITLAVTANYYKTFTSPNPNLKATLYDADGEPVGTACYAVSPLDDRVYLFELEIAPQHRRRGYATALLWYLARTYGQPITPVHELYVSGVFWDAGRRMGGAGLVVTSDLRASEMDEEALRWRHLRADAERLERQIVERIALRHEPWEVATGRGLESGGDWVA